jgi:predicted RNase H-like nuclease (RuvC/YqgF family)
MDIERLKKLNSLAGELKHQGIAQDHEDAAFLAVTMVGEQEEQCLSDMHINDDQSLVVREIIKAKPIKPQEESVKQSAEALDVQQYMKQSMTKEDVQQILQSFATQIVSEFNALQEKIEQNNAQINQLVQKINEVQSSTHKQVQEQVPVQRTLYAQPTQPVAAEPAVANPRTGNFAADDVSIDKMFYFGSKK